MKCIFDGVGTAIITPFKKDKVDYDKLGELIEFQLNNGVKAIIALGTTGEPSTLTKKEKLNIVRFCKQKIKGNTKLIVGAGDNDTKKVVSFCKSVEKIGVDGFLIVTPYYNKCTQQGLIKHYKIINDNVSTPIIVYNVPGRTGVNILPKTMEQISSFSNIFGLKEANGDINQITEDFYLLKDKIAIYSGEDGLNYVFMTLGGKGCISVTSNVCPREVSQVINNTLKGKFNLAYSVQKQLRDINKALFVEVNPIPVKYALSLLNLYPNTLRLPLTSLSKEYENKVYSALFEIYNHKNSKIK